MFLSRILTSLMRDVRPCGRCTGKLNQLLDVGEARSPRRARCWKSRRQNWTSSSTTQQSAASSLRIVMERGKEIWLMDRADHHDTASLLVNPRVTRRSYAPAAIAGTSCSTANPLFGYSITRCMSPTNMSITNRASPIPPT